MGVNESRQRTDDSSSVPPRVRIASSSSSVTRSDLVASSRVLSLGQDLMTFLRVSNLSGLEYRLRLAGYSTMKDLLKTNEEKLIASGLTPLMTSRLIAALANYHRQKSATHPARARPARQETSGQRPLRQQKPVSHKRNVKRTRAHSPTDPALPRRPAPVKVLSQEDVPDAHLIARDCSPDNDNSNNDTNGAAIQRGSLKGHSTSSPDILCSGPTSRDLFSPPKRSYSCPVIFSGLPATTTSLSSLLAEAISNEDEDEAAIQLKELCHAYVQSPHLLTASDDVELACRALSLWYEEALVAEWACWLIKALSRGVPAGTIPPGTMLAVLDAMCSHPNEVKVQLQAYLAAANIGRAVPHHCKALVYRGGISAVVAGLQRFQNSCALQTAGLSLLSVTFAGEPEGRLKFLAEHMQSIDQVILAMQSYAQDEQLVENCCAFFTLLLIGVCHQLECSVVVLVVDHILQAMTAFPQSEAIQVWGCKVISHSTTSDIFSDSELVMRCAQAVISAVRGFPSKPPVQTWGAYALYQIAYCNSQSAAIITVVYRDLLSELCQKRSCDLTEEANVYLSYLQAVLET